LRVNRRGDLGAVKLWVRVRKDLVCNDLCIFGVGWKYSQESLALNARADKQVVLNVDCHEGFRGARSLRLGNLLGLEGLVLAVLITVRLRISVLLAYVDSEADVADLNGLVR